MEFPRSFPAALRLSSAFTADELEAAEILLDFAAKSDDCIRFPSAWGAKRRRSAANKAPPAAGNSDYSSNSPNSPLLFPSNSNRSLPKTIQEVKRTKITRNELMAENMRLQETDQLNDDSDASELRLMNQTGPSTQLPRKLQMKGVGRKEIIVIPDLNAPVEEFLADMECRQPLMSHLQLGRRAEAAAFARQHRRLIQIIKRAKRGCK